MFNRLKIIAFASIVLLVSCKASQKVEQENAVRAEVTPAVTREMLSDELEQLSQTVKKLDCLVFYMTTFFPPENKLAPRLLTAEQMEKAGTRIDVTNESVSGTATVIYYDGKLAGLLSCAHVVDFVDTVYRYYEDGSLFSVSVKLRQQIYISGLPPGDDVEVVALDKKSDIVLLKKNIRVYDHKPLAVMTYPRGKSKDLDWGMEVYTMGYPLGKLMVTRSVVSKPQSDNGWFYSDALFNRGISGSPVVAVQQEEPVFKWVGMACSASAETLRYLKPQEDLPQLISSGGTPYEGPVFVENKKSIKYGVTTSVTVDQISRFLSVNAKAIRAAGFDPDNFFK